MAELNNRSEATKKEYATDEAGMMADAKQYAKDDFRTVLPLVEKLDGKEATEDRKKEIADALIQVKYEAIKSKRLGVDALFA